MLTLTRHWMTARGSKIAVAIVSGLLITSSVSAGVFLNQTAGKVTHAGNYTGTGGERVINVCFDSGAVPLSGNPTQATENVVAEFNRFQALLGNVANAAASGVPLGEVDYETFLMHEMGHCLGLDHNVLGPSEVGCSVGGTCLNSPTLFFTNSTVGANVTHEAFAGADGARATGDDARGDDVNRHWYRAGVNNPFADPIIADRTTYVQSGGLPDTDNFAQAATSFGPCTQGTASSNTSTPNGQPATMDVLFPIICTSNVVRDLSPEDRNTFRVARAGVDGMAGNADDYTVRLNFQGNTQAGCDIRIRFPSGGGYSCSVNLSELGNGDSTIADDTLDADTIAGTINMQRETSWFFNQFNPSRIFCNGLEDAACLP